MLPRSLHTISIIFRHGAALMAKPIIKWAGGKQGVAETIVSHFPNRYRVYYEPFVGGGSILLTLNPKQAIIGDLNKWLVDTYKAVRKDWQKVATILDCMVNSKEYFLGIRLEHPDNVNIYERAARFIYLNKTCFRGLFRVNKNGQFNVPYGAYSRRYYDPDNLKEFSKSPESLDVRWGDFELISKDISKDDFIYLDPPYYRLGGYSDFNRYTQNQFRENDQIRLANFCNILDDNGIRWAQSNSNTPFIQKLYSRFRINRIKNRREINLNSANRDIDELLIMNYSGH